MPPISSGASNVNQEMALRRQSNALQNEANRQNQLLADFNKDMIIWETTGSAPNTPAMQYYGIAPGTPFSDETKQAVTEKLQETQARIQLIAAEEELQFQNRATNFMQAYGVSRGVAEAALIIIDQTSNFSDARKMANTQKPSLTAEGINTTHLLQVLEKYFNTQNAYGGVDAVTGAAPQVSSALASSYDLLTVGENVPAILEAKFPNAEENRPYYDSRMNASYAKVGGQWYFLSPK